MRIANLAGRTVLLIDESRGVDVAEASHGAFGPDPGDVLADWTRFRAWAEQLDLLGVPGGARRVIAPSALGSPSPAPRQIVAVGLNYLDHAAESGFAVPEHLPPTFTKFVSSLTGPNTTILLPDGGHTDWEVELVVVIGREGWQVSEAEAWSYVAGVTVGQDLSERISQLRGPAPQFSLGKSYPGFTPVGPVLVTADELHDRNDLEIGCSVNGEIVQHARTSQLLFPVAALVSRLSQIVTLYPGDLIFTGTPAGVGQGRSPQRFLAPGDVLISWIEGVGEVRQEFIGAAHQSPATSSEAPRFDSSEGR